MLVKITAGKHNGKKVGEIVELPDGHPFIARYPHRFEVIQEQTGPTAPVIPTAASVEENPPVSVGSESTATFVAPAPIAPATVQAAVGTPEPPKPVIPTVRRIARRKS